MKHKQMKEQPSFFDFAAEVGLTKHIGGIAATEALIELCHIGRESSVLDVGCGVGATACFIAARVGCRVVGVDILEKMVERSRERASRQKLTHRVEFRVADAQNLPFEDNLFDAVLTESVTAFPEDKQKAVREYARVANPSILPAEKPTDEMWTVIGGGIGQYNQQHGGPEGFQHLCFALYDPDGKVAGGLIGEIYWGWFYINLLFVCEELRGQGYGHQLLTQAEEEASKRGATNAFFDTFSFQAPEFYKQHGYHVFGELKDFPPGHTRYYMTKAL